MNKILASLLIAVIAGLAIEAMTPAAVASTTPEMGTSTPVAMPAPRAPFDETPITAVETVGASSTE